VIEQLIHDDEALELTVGVSEIIQSTSLTLATAPMNTPPPSEIIPSTPRILANASINIAPSSDVPIDLETPSTSNGPPCTTVNQQPPSHAEATAANIPTNFEAKWKKNTVAQLRGGKSTVLRSAPQEGNVSGILL
jgi:hypothetical protein